MHQPQRRSERPGRGDARRAARGQRRAWSNVEALSPNWAQITNEPIVVSNQFTVTNPVPAPILSISFASCENDNGRSSSIAFDQLYQQAAAEGISVFVASGDGGVAGCEALDATPSTTQIASTNTLCASGYVTCVGGTEFADTARYLHRQLEAAGIEGVEFTATVVFRPAPIEDETTPM